MLAASVGCVVAMSSHHQMPSVKQAQLLRQASVLHEIQESQEKDSLEGRYARLIVRATCSCCMYDHKQ